MPPLPQFYNVPISGDPKEADHPVHLIKQMAKPGDFVVRGAGRGGAGAFPATCTAASLLAVPLHLHPPAHPPTHPLATIPRWPFTWTLTTAWCGWPSPLPRPLPRPAPYPPPSTSISHLCCSQAIKLDVDNSPVELAFMNEVKRDPELRALIGELFFEQHYSHE